MIITFGHSKGGVGKSTLLSNLAVRFAEAGDSVLIVDADPQNSIAQWAEFRRDSEAAPSITCFQRTGRVAKDLNDIETKYDVVLVDTGGRDAIELRSALPVSDLVVVPVIASHFDVWAAARMVEIVESARDLNPRLEVLLVSNCAETHPSVHDTEDARGLLASEFSEFALASTVVHSRRAFKRAVEFGLAVHEAPPSKLYSGRWRVDTKAAEETSRLAEEVVQILSGNNGA